MAEVVQMFLFLYKSKYRRKTIAHGLGGLDFALVFIWTLFLAAVCFASVNDSSSTCDLDNCLHGDCVNGSCVCHYGWQGTGCRHCGAKVRLSEPSGSIRDGHGNYTVNVRCTWLIESTANSTIRLHVEEFATECGWDHLYIYDGDSVEAPLLAVFTGLMYKDDYHIRRVPEIMARSGSAFLHFFSDSAYNMSGFNISYEANGCPSGNSHNCSGHGVCIDGTCTCDAMWTGYACETEICPRNCSYQHGQGECNRENHRCDCTPGFRGSDCSQRSEYGFWEAITYKDISPEGSASHCSIVWSDSLYIVGGESFNRAKMIYVYDYTGNVWETLHVEGKFPQPRYAHSCVLFGDKIYMYGGIIINSTVTNEIWAFDISSQDWENVTVHDNCNNKSMCGPLKVAGHTANLIPGHGHEKRKDKMVVIFGYSPQYGYLNTVQEYSFGMREWQIVDSIGFPVKGGFGHSSAYDQLTKLIYVYGGYVSVSQISQSLTSRLYSYHPNLREWKLLTAAPSARFFHTAAFISGGMMLVFGGNTHNDTMHSRGARCYSADTLAYDVTCDTWHHFPMPRDIDNVPRFGHSASVFGGSMYIYGGFDGQMMSDMLRYTPGKCDEFRTQSQCLNATTGVKCIWNTTNGRCITLTKKIQDFLRENRYDETYMKCVDDTRPRGMTSQKELCKLLNDCTACVQTSYNCVWCGKSCSHEICRDNAKNAPMTKAITHLDQCDLHSGVECFQLHTCHACTSNPNCIWSWSNGPDRCKPRSKVNRELGGNGGNNDDNNNNNNNNNNVIGSSNNQNETNNSASSTGGITQSQRLTATDACRNPCVEYTSCRNCTESDCIWCQSQKKCVEKIAYLTTFPYGQCREWTSNDRAKCHPTEAANFCSFYASCDACRYDPECGWCDDGSGTGKGQCLPGGNRGPSDKSIEKCPHENWYFTSCPTCQCNGHSTCLPNSSACIQPCANLTYGPHCDKCVPGYYGNPINGATCQQCFCNNHGTSCTPDTGKCHCTTKGILGDHCERCDVSGTYHGDPTTGTCFYDLTIDYQFTFNLSKKEDNHYTGINFKNSPSKPDIDAEFSITCSVLAKMNITIKKANSAEKSLLVGANCTTYKHRFSKADYNFGSEDNNTLTTFYVYVYDFQTPLWIQISFSQYSKLNLQQFFITFSTCFLALLLVAAVLWKIKQKYDMYRRRQRLFVEMQQMANRAFSQVLVEIERRDQNGTSLERSDSTESSNCRKKKKDAPSPIALEPCCGNRAAVLSLLVRLPTGGESFTPAGQSAGLAVASALVTLGSPRRPSQEMTTKEPKKSRKSASQHPDSTCI